MTQYKLSPEITLPASAPTSTFAFLGTRRYGKTYSAGVMVEEFLDANVQCVIIDPVGTWWALRLSADGKKKGISIPVFGGEHGDIPLQHTAGKLVAKIVVEQKASLVLDLSDFTDGQQRRFVTDFAKELYQLKKRSKSPLHLVFEECHEFFPQTFDSSQYEMVGATKRLWKIGGNLGIGGSLISQRTAEVNKGALNLSDTIVTTRLKAPEDVKRISGWANSNGVSDDAVAKLPTLPKQRVIVWREDGTAVETTFRKKRTFDSSRTPEEGDQQSVSALPKIDLEKIRAAMAATLEEEPGKPNPEVVRLKEENKNLRAQLAQKKPEIVYQTPPGIVELVTKVAENLGTFVDHAEKIADLRSDVVLQLGRITKQSLLTSSPPKKPSKLTEPVTSQEPAEDKSPKKYTLDQLRLAPGAQRMLAALKNSLSPSLHQRNVAMLSGMKITGTFSTYKSVLKQNGYVDVNGAMMTITDRGRAYEVDVDAPKTPAEIIGYWKSQLPDKCSLMLDFIVSNGRATQAEMAKAADMSESGTFSTYKSKIVSAGLIVKVGPSTYEPAPAIAS